MYWHDFKLIDEDAICENLNDKKNKAIDIAIKKINSERSHIKLNTETIGLYVIEDNRNAEDNRDKEDVYLFKLKVTNQIDPLAGMHRQILDPKRYESFHIYVIDLGNEPEVLRWEKSQTDYIMSVLLKIHATLLECCYIKKFLTLESHSRNDNRQIELIITDGEKLLDVVNDVYLKIDRKKNTTHSDDVSTINPCNLLSNKRIIKLNEDIDNFSNCPKKIKESLKLIPKKHKSSEFSAKIISIKLKKIFNQKEKSNQSNENNLTAKVIFSSVSIIDGKLLIKEFSYDSQKEAYEDIIKGIHKPSVIFQYAIDSLINQHRYEVRELASGLKILCTQRTKKLTSSYKILDFISKENDDFDKKGVLIANHITDIGKLRLGGGSTRSITFENVDFRGEVVLDGGIFRGSVTFIRCRFYTRFSARDTSIEGSLKFQDCIIHGDVKNNILNNEGIYTKPSLVLHGLSVSKSFFIISTTVFGRIRGRWIQVGNIFEIRDARVYGSINEKNIHNRSLVDLGYATVGGPFVITSSLNESSGIPLRSYISGDCQLEGLEANSFHANGIYIAGTLNLESARIQSTITIDKQIASVAHGIGWLTHIAKDLILKYAHCELLTLNQIQIGGKFSLEEAEVEHSCELNTSFETNGRCIIHGDAVFNGARIKGDISARGAYIEGDLSLITGTFDRLHVNATWIKSSNFNYNKLLKILPTEIKGNIYLADCKLGSLALVGIKVSYSIITNNVLINGRVRFWGVKRKKLMFNEARKFIKKGAVVRAIETNNAIDSVRASVGGGIDLTNANVMGGIDFSKLNTKNIVLNGVDLSSDLNFNTDCVVYWNFIKIYNKSIVVVYKKPSIIVYKKPSVIVDCGVSLVGARIKGNLDLRGLLIEKGKLDATDVKAQGSVICAESSNSHDNLENKNLYFRCLLVKSGDIDFSGLASKSLFISDNCLSEKDAKYNGKHGEFKSADNKEKNSHIINLSRSHLGQLTIYGLGKVEEGKEAGGLNKRKEKPFCAKINLYAAKINDWNFVDNNDKENHELCFILLTATDNYFDARNYLDIENRLHSIGKIGLSNRVYREMGIRVNRENNKRSLSLNNIDNKFLYRLFHSQSTTIQFIVFLLTPIIVAVKYLSSSVKKISYGSLGASSKVSFLSNVKNANYKIWILLKPFFKIMSCCFNKLVSPVSVFKRIVVICSARFSFFFRKIYDWISKYFCNIYGGEIKFIRFFVFLLAPIIISFIYLKLFIVYAFLLFKTKGKNDHSDYLHSIKETNHITSEALYRDSDGFLFNWVFTHGRTKPSLMFFWLILFSLPSLLIACNSENIAIERSVTTFEIVMPNYYYQFVDYNKKLVTIQNDAVSCERDDRINPVDWNVVKAIGIAVTYAVPFYQSAKIDPARLSTKGCTYVLGMEFVSLSPHDVAQFFSIFQYALWILIAANLPAIIRRRN